MWKSEQRYAAAAAFVAAEAPRNAVVLSVQHSGAVAYYTGRTIARWDYIAPGALDDVCARLSAAGHASWLVVDDWEEAPFRQRFAGEALGRLDWAPLGEARVGAARVRVYDLDHADSRRGAGVDSGAHDVVVALGPRPGAGHGEVRFRL